MNLNEHETQPVTRPAQPETAPAQPQPTQPAAPVSLAPVRILRPQSPIRPQGPIAVRLARVQSMAQNARPLPSPPPLPATPTQPQPPEIPTQSQSLPEKQAATTPTISELPKPSQPPADKPVDEAGPTLSEKIEDQPRGPEPEPSNRRSPFPGYHRGENLTDRRRQRHPEDFANQPTLETGRLIPAEETAPLQPTGPNPGITRFSSHSAEPDFDGEIEFIRDEDPPHDYGDSDKQLYYLNQELSYEYELPDRYGETYRREVNYRDQHRPNTPQIASRQSHRIPVPQSLSRENSSLYPSQESSVMEQNRSHRFESHQRQSYLPQPASPFPSSDNHSQDRRYRSLGQERVSGSTFESASPNGIHPVTPIASTSSRLSETSIPSAYRAGYLSHRKTAPARYLSPGTLSEPIDLTPRHSAHPPIIRGTEGTLFVDSVFLNQHPASEYAFEPFSHLFEMEFYVKDDQGKYIATNEAMLRSKNLDDPRHLLGHTDDDFLPPALADANRAEDQGVLLGTPVSNRVWFDFDPLGHLRWYVFSKRPFRNGGEKINGIYGIKRYLDSKSARDHFHHLAKVFPLLEHRQDQLSIREMAHLAGVSTEQLDRDFMNLLGKPCYQFLLSFRIEKARHLLTHGTTSVLDISRATGFQDEYHFIREFERWNHLHPQAYRNRYQAAALPRFGR